MRGADERPGSMFSYVWLEERVPADHPLRAVRGITDRALARMTTQFDTLYVKFGRPSIPSEKPLRALLLRALYTIRSERQLMTTPAMLTVSIWSGWGRDLCCGITIPVNNFP